MAYMTADCPSCRAERVGMPLIGVISMDSSFHGSSQKKWFALGAVYCGKCLAPFGVRITADDQNVMLTSQLDAALGKAFTQSADVGHFALTWTIFAVEVPRASLDHLPPIIERALKQADDNFHRPGCEEPASVFYGRAIELALKHAHPTVTGSLSKRILKLASERVIPQALSDWANEVRIIRNDGAHDDGVSREDAQAARDFTDAFLRYLIVMPEMVEARRRKAASEIGAEEPS